MNRYKLATACFSMVLSFAYCAKAESLALGAALPTLDTAPDKEALLERIYKAQEDVNRFGGGHVIVGRVLVEPDDDPALVNSQMQILPGGYFADATKDLVRPVGFRMHQYTPYDLHLAGLTGDIVDVGIIQMRRLAERELVPVKGEIVMVGGGDPRQATVEFHIRSGPVNTPSNGTEPRPRWAEPVIVPVWPEGVIDTNGFSPVTCYCSVTAPGFVKQGFTVDFDPKLGADIGMVWLDRPCPILLDYVVSREGSFEGQPIQQVMLKGGDRFKATPDIYGWDIEFVQEANDIYFTYFYAPCFIADLGEGQIEDFLDADEAAATIRPRDLMVNNGHVYILNQRHWKRLVLFKVTIEPPRRGGRR